MKKPFYKNWLFWVVVIVVGGIIGLTTGGEEPADQAAPAATEEAQPAAAEPTTEPTVAPTQAPTAAPTKAPAPTVSADWESEISDIIAAGGSKTEKAGAVEALAKKYEPQNEQLFDYFQFMVGELADKKYLAQIDNDEYMLSNIFKSLLVEKHAQNDHLKDFAFDFYQNTKYTYRGADTVDSDSVLANEAQMAKALAQIKIE